MSDIYKTISQRSEGEFRDKGSKFIAYAFPLVYPDDWHEQLDSIKKLHPKARHHCFAFRYGMDKNNFRANDDGEPSGTAGFPILGQIDSFGLTNVFVVVIRYFGGTLLGTSGLKNAYKTSTHEALASANIIEKTIENIYSFTFGYEIMNEVMNALKKLDIHVLNKSFTDICQLQIGIPTSKVDEIFLQLRIQIHHLHQEEAELLEGIEGVEIEFIRQI